MAATPTTDDLLAARETVEDLFFELLADESGAALAATPGAAQAALRYLRARHVDGVAPTEAWEKTAELAGVLRRLVRSGGPGAARALIDLALDAARPAEARPLADVLMGVVTPDELARALADALEGDDRRRWVNARELAYHTFDAAGEDYAPGPHAQAGLAAALATPDPNDQDD